MSFLRVTSEQIYPAERVCVRRDLLANVTCTVESASEVGGIRVQAERSRFATGVPNVTYRLDLDNNTLFIEPVQSYMRNVVVRNTGPAIADAGSVANTGIMIDRVTRAPRSSDVSYRSCVPDPRRFPLLQTVGARLNITIHLWPGAQYALI